MNPQAQLRPRDGVVWRELGGVLMVLDGTSGRYFRLDRSAGRIWRLIEEHGSPEAIIESLGEEHDGSRVDLEHDIRTFIDTALANNLLEAGPGSAPHQEQRPSDGPVLQIKPSGLAVSTSLDTLREEFQRNDYVHLPQLIEPGLLTIVEQSVKAGQFVDRGHAGIGTEQCLVPGLATGILQLMFNDPALLQVAADIAGCGPVRCFDGRVYRLAADEGHYDSWHSDAGEDRLVAVSVNLSREPYEGGVLEIRQASSTEISHVVSNAGFGNAVMFRISPALRHRVTAVKGSRPRTAYAGWFRSSPDFQDLFFASLPRDFAST